MQILKNRRTFIVLSLLILTIWSGLIYNTFAVFTVGQTNNPACGPADPTCYVDITAVFPPLNSGLLFVGNASNIATGVAMSGDATISNTGALTIADNSVDGTDIALGSDAAGDIMYYNGTDYVRLGIGTAGQVLTVNGGATAPTWSAGGGGTTLYSGDGTLAGNRVITSGGNSLTYDGTGDIVFADSGLLTTVGLTSSGNISQTGATTFSTGTGAISLNGATSITGTNTLTVGTGLTILGGEFRLSAYPNTRNDTATTLPVRALYTDASGNVLSSPIYSNRGLIKYYAENATAPATASPTATGLNSVAFGNAATASSQHMFVYGHQSGIGATNAEETNMIGYQAGFNATNAYNSNYIGRRAGFGATNGNDSTFIGFSAGEDATAADHSVFIGNSAGLTAAGASRSVFIGELTGSVATNAVQSVFIGNGAGNIATNANQSFFGGDGAGSAATNSNNSIFIGTSAGSAATDSSNSVFIGTSAGQMSGGGAGAANNSVFLGVQAGSTAETANNSIFIGNMTGVGDLVDNTGAATDYSILIGNGASTGGFSNSIALGANAVNTASNQFIVGDGAIAGTSIDIMILNGNGNTCTLDVTVASPSCTSDERLKDNITDLGSTLDRILQVRTVNYTWKNYPTSGTETGFIAQDLQNYFPEFVSTMSNGYLAVSYGGMTSPIVKAIQEMNLKITDIEKTDTPNTWRDALVNWFKNTSNGITEFIAGTLRAKNEICIDDVCINKNQLQTLLQNSGSTTSTSVPVIPVPSIDTPVSDTTDSGSVDSDTPTSDTSDTVTDSGDTVSDTPVEVIDEKPVEIVIVPVLDTPTGDTPIETVSTE